MEALDLRRNNQKQHETVSLQTCKGLNSSVLLPQDPTVCQTEKPGTRDTGSAFQSTTPKGWNRTHAARLNAGHLLIDIPPLSTHRRTYVSDMGISCKTPHPTLWKDTDLEVLLRKEVIQPHLPVRLPCYDLVPIAGPTFDGSLPQGVRPPASGVTNFRDLTGGVYKARERIHRSVADLRLLATPTS